MKILKCCKWLLRVATNYSAMSSGGFGTTHYQIIRNDNRKNKR